MNKYRYVALFSAAVILAGCTAQTRQVVADSGDSVGHYSIPGAYIQAKLELSYPESLIDNSSDGSPLDFSNVQHKIKVTLTPKKYSHSQIPVSYKPNSFSHDKLTIELDEGGYLKQVATDTSDQTAEFITNAVSLYTQGQRLAVDLGPPANVLSRDGGTIDQEIYRILDPWSTSPVTIDPIGNRTGDEITISFSSPPGTSSGSFSVADCQDKICYPALVTRLVEVESFAGLEQHAVAVPDPGRLFAIDFSRAAFVQKTITVDFEEGIFKKIALDKPSEANAVIQVPLNVLKAIVALPAELIQFKIDTTNTATEELEAQKGLIEAQQALIEALATAEDAQADGDAPPQ